MRNEVKPENFLTENQVISKGGASFMVLAVSDKYVLCEQRIEDKIVAYEVSHIRVSKRYTDFKLRKGGEYYYTIPTNNAFGLKKYDKSFTANRKQDALNYFKLISC